MSTSDDSDQDTFIVPAPFDDPTLADIVLRSSDGVDFYVFKGHLMVESPVFRDMVSLPQPIANVTPGFSASADNVTEGGLPIVSLSEGSAVINNILCYLYPFMELPTLQDPELILSILKATRKYEMNRVSAKVTTALNELMIAQQGSNALQMYRLARKCCMDDIARSAIFDWLRCPLKNYSSLFDGSLPISEVECMLQYRKQVVEIIFDLLSYDHLSGSYSSAIPRALKEVGLEQAQFSAVGDVMKKLNKCIAYCRDCKGLLYRIWRSRILEGVLRAPLAHTYVTMEGIQDAARSADLDCSACQIEVLQNGLKYIAKIQQAINEAASKVEFAFV